MVPEGTGGICQELVGEAFAGGDWTLSDAGRAVGPGCANLINAMEVEASGLVLKLVGYAYPNGIANLSLDGGAGELPINAYNAALKLPIWVCFDPSDIPFIFNNVGVGYTSQAEDGKREDFGTQHGSKLVE